MPLPAERFDWARRQMDVARRELEDSLAAIEPSLWVQQPAPGRWSVSQVVQHLQLVEARVLARMERALAAGVPPRPDWRRFFHLPVSWVEGRGVRVKTFDRFDPREPVPAEQVLAEWRAVRERLWAVLAPHREHDLRGHCARHPFLGFLDGYAWMAYLGAHERRHGKQIAETVAALRAEGACRPAA